MNKPVYMDYAATTPVDRRVAEKMFECLTADGNFGSYRGRSPGDYFYLRCHRM